MNNASLQTHVTWYKGKLTTSNYDKGVLKLENGLVSFTAEDNKQHFSMKVSEIAEFNVYYGGGNTLNGTWYIIPKEQSDTQFSFIKNGHFDEDNNYKDWLGALDRMGVSTSSNKKFATLFPIFILGFVAVVVLILYLSKG